MRMTSDGSGADKGIDTSSLNDGALHTPESICGAGKEEHAGCKQRRRQHGSGCLGKLGCVVVVDREGRVHNKGRCVVCI